MSAHFEELVIFAVTSVLVALFSWIYVRDHQPKSRLWLFAWIAILVHFTAPAIDEWLTWLEPFTPFVQVSTLILAGTFFLLSVSEVFRDFKHRLMFVLFVGGTSFIYLTAFVAGVHVRWPYISLLLLSTLWRIVQAAQHYGLKSRHVWTMFALILPYGAWAVLRAFRGDPEQGLNFYLYSYFTLIALAYFRKFRRFSPGVILTSASFLTWGAIFPISSYLLAHHIGPSEHSVFWDLPKFFVAFGMILTLYESQTETANNIARQYRDLFQSNLAGVYVSTWDGKLLNCNSAFCRMYGFSSVDDALKMSTQSFYVESWERESFLQALRDYGQVLNYECRQRRNDGSVFWILERAKIAVNVDGQEFIEGTAIDISERKEAELALKQSEERFGTVFRQSPLGCGILSLDGVFLNVNENMLRVLARPAERVIGRSGMELGLWKSQFQRDNFYGELRTHGSVKNLEVEFIDAAGNKHEGLYNATLVKIEGKECIFGMYLDQTDKRELEAKFLQSQKMEALGRLAGGVAHDFNNLLGVIGGYAELLEAKLAPNDGYRRYCSKILDTTQRASGLTQQLLTFSRKEITRPAPLNPDDALRDLATILPRLIGEDIELILNLNSTGTVLMDKTHFEQIIFNVAINSRDAMPDGGQLFIETEDISRPLLTASGGVAVGHYVGLRIRDTGTGMDDETRLHAFEPFYTTKETGRGTGLGLATVYGIVQQCGGQISIESQLNHGTEISILLSTVGRPVKPESAGARLDITRGSGYILLVEDEAALREANAEFLTGMGYSVRCAGSGPEALQIAREYDRIDLVITDVVMPRMNGHEFIVRLLEERPQTKWLFVSGYADDIILKQGLTRDGLPLLQKPFSLRQLARKVQELLAAPANQQMY